MSTQRENILELMSELGDALHDAGVAYKAYLDALTRARKAATRVAEVTGEVINQPHIEIGDNYEIDG